MRKQLLQRIGAVCTSAAISMGALALCNVDSVTANAADDNYAKLLQYSLYFYDANMCGQVGSKSAFEWRGDCHLQDEVKGGYHDAGDHAMFGLPQGYTASTIGWAYYEFEDAFKATGQADHFKTVFKHFTDFFKASTQLDGNGGVSRFLYQKGDGDLDHKYWGKPENQEQVQGKREMFWTSNSASDIAADYAAALAIDSILYGDSQSLEYAKALYKFSTQYNAIEKRGPLGFYLDKEHPEWASPQDEQAWAAGWLYLATKDNFYKEECAKKQTDIGWCHGWNTVNLGAACLYGEISGDWTRASSWLNQKCQGSNYFWIGDGGEWGSARINCSVQMTALVAAKHNKGNFGDWCKGQMHYILGANPANTCFVCGFADNSSKNTHHRAASGYNSYDELGENTTYSPNGHILTGALAGGPGDQGGSYSDSIKDYKCNEVALDYNAGLVGAAAGLYSLYKSGTPDTNVNGIGPVNVTPQPVETAAPPVQTDAPQTQAPVVTQAPQTQAPTPSGDGSYKISPATKFVWSQTSEDERMIAWPWSDFEIKSGEVATKVVFNLSTTKGNLGTWKGAFGTGTSVSPDYWYMTKDATESLSGSSATLTWEVPADVAKTINYNRDDCPLKLGIWWIDSDEVTVDSIQVYTSGGTTTVQTQPPVVTTTAPKQTQAPTQTTAAPKQTQAPVQTTAAPKQTQAPLTATLWGDIDLSGDVDVSDAVLAARYSVGDRVNVKEQGIVNADVTHDGVVKNDDVLKLVRFCAGYLTRADLANK